MKTLKNICAFVLVIMLLLGVVAGVGRVVTGSWDFGKWVENVGEIIQPDTAPDTTVDNPDTSVVALSSDGAILTTGDSNGIEVSSAKLPRAAYAVSGVSAQADTAYLITASVTPSDTTYKQCDWTVAWQDAKSEWATGKKVTDYVTITPTSDGALTANAVCLQAFGEPVIVTVLNRHTPTVYATIKCDYISRIESIGVAFDYGGNRDFVWFHHPFCDGYEFEECPFAYGYTPYSYTAYPGDIAVCSTSLGTMSCEYVYTITTYSWDKETVLYRETNTNGSFSWDVTLEGINDRFSGDNGFSPGADEMLQAFIAEYGLYMSIEVSNGYSKVEVSFPLIFDKDLCTVEASSMTTDTPNIAF